MQLNKIEKAPCIFLYEDAFDSSNIIDLLEDESEREWPYLSWSESQTGDGSRSKISQYRTSLEMPLYPVMQEEVEESLNKLKNTLIDNILDPINQCIWDYRRYFDLHLQTDTGYSVLKYYPGSEYHIHYDHAPSNSRVLSAVACLGNDDFDGGELEFNNFDLTLKLKKNSLILFPSNFPYTHIAHPVTNGIKYSLVTWFV